MSLIEASIAMVAANDATNSVHLKYSQIN